MNDRELLEMAAKPAGIGGGWGNMFEYHNGAVDLRDMWILDGDDFMPWNPLTDDGDALRLAVKLKLDVCFYDGFGEVGVQADFGEMILNVNEDYNDDLHAATRRAITRAAAEIGRKME